MYPRLRLARTLLRDDGIIFISIDSGEVANLRLICDELFGEDSFIVDLIWKKRDGAPNDRTIGSVHDHLLVYGKALCSGFSRTQAEDTLNLMPRTAKADAEYKVFPEPGGPDSRGAFRKIDTTANAKGGRNVASLHYGITNPHTGEVVRPREGTCWRHSQAEMNSLQQDGRLYWGVRGTAKTPMRKLFHSEAKQGMSTPSILPGLPLNQHAARELEVLFGQKSVFDTPKPVDLLRLLVQIGSDPGDLVLDFFAGSGSFAHAVMALNLESEANRRYILVQLPEPLDPMNKDHEIAAACCDKLRKPRRLTELTKERLRRAASKIKAEAPKAAGDLGFRVFKLDSSNIRAWEPAPDDLHGSLMASVEHLKPGRSEADVLYELLLKLGLDLCVPIEKRDIAGQNVYAVGGGVLLACLVEAIIPGEIEPLAQGIVAWHEALGRAGDTTCVFRDSAFADDVAKTNMAAILEQHGIAHVRSL